VILDYSGPFVRNSAAAHALAAASAALAIIANMLEDGLFGDRPFIALYAAVVISAYAGGFGPGLLATLLSAAAVSYLLLEPYASFTVRAGEDVAGLILFIIASLFICWILHSLRRAAETLRIERDLSRELAGRLERTVHQKEILVREIQHRVSNSLQLVSSFLMLQRRAIANPDARRDLEEASNRIHALAHIHRRLYAAGEEERVEFTNYLKGICSDLVQATAPRTVACTVDGPAGIWLPQDKVVPLALIVNELITNALEHGLVGRNDGRIAIMLERRSDNRAALTVSDNGFGLPADFDPETIQSIGLKIVHALSAQINGTLRLLGSRGATWELEFPI
jgi:two-component system, sensor histidine kinase PdtaS